MINKINKLPQSEFIKVFANIFENASWIAEEFSVLPRLHPTDDQTWTQAPISAQLYGIPMDTLPERGEDLDGQGSIVQNLFPG